MIMADDESEVAQNMQKKCITYNRGPLSDENSQWKTKIWRQNSSGLGWKSGDVMKREKMSSFVKTLTEFYTRNIIANNETRGSWRWQALPPHCFTKLSYCSHSPQFHTNNHHCNRNNIADQMGWRQNRPLPWAAKALALPLALSEILDM